MNDTATLSTAFLFREQPYLFACSATVIALTEKGPILDRTVAYAAGGGQPGDTGVIEREGLALPFSEARYADETRRTILHPVEGAPFAIGEPVTVRLDSARRLRHMRIHTALHLLSVVLPYPVTGGAIGDGEGRLDFDIAEAGLDREAIAEALNALVARDLTVSERTITDAELDANPQLVKTMAVKPPRGSGLIRLVEIDGVDLQPCGGTHVARTGEIGTLAVTGIEKKGRQNRRVRIALAGNSDTDGPALSRSGR